MRRGDDVIATGHIQLDEQPTPGELITLGSTRARVEEVLSLHDRRRLILSQL